MVFNDHGRTFGQKRLFQPMAGGLEQEPGQEAGT